MEGVALPVMIGAVTGAALAVLSVGGLYAALRPWAEGRVQHGGPGELAIVRLVLVLLGLWALTLVGRAALISGAATLLLVRPLLVHMLARRLETSVGNGPP
jgi:hypothetical protein